MTDADALVKRYEKGDAQTRAFVEARVAQNDKRDLDNDRRAWVGMVLGFVIAIAGLVVAAYVATRGSGAQAAAGAAIGVGDLGALVSVFVVQGRREGSSA